MTRSTKAPQWSFVAGEKGRNRVRVYPDVRTGRLFIEFREHGRRVAMALGHRDREQAKAQAEELATRLRHPELADRQRLTLGALFEMYVAEVSPTKSEGGRRYDQSTARSILAIVGAGKPACDLSHRDAARFVAERRRRGDQRRTKAGVTMSRPLGTRGIEANVTFWQAVLNWAVNGGLLDRNPLRGFRVKQERAPKRPNLSAEEYARLLAVADEVPVSEQGPSLFRLALVLAHETGHRVGAIRHLRWSDVELDEARIQWRPEHDKMGFAHETPLTPAAVAVLREARRSRPSIGDGLLFPSLRVAGQPLTREVLSGWWLDAEKRAGLVRIERRGWHSLRRKFATEMKHTPLRDLCQLGGWKDHSTVLTCYTQPDPVTMREALAQRVSLAAAK